MKHGQKRDNKKGIFNGQAGEKQYGAIERDGYIFDIEYSVIQQKGALHVYRDGVLMDEVTFRFTGEKPDEQQIESLIDHYIHQHSG
jgi:Family of unknown function (DUF5370)